ncbi:MAG: acyl-CoA dehydrogenase family protein [Sphingomonadaceae bacterium]|nr:acyl-CoA dehydrogenase family protein [Sphingomonadaceae bacterium]
MDAETFAAFKDQIRRFVRERLVPAEPEVMELGQLPDWVLAEMREMGLFGLTVPTEYGGLGLSLTEYIETITEIAWAAPAFRAVLSINTGMICTALRNAGTDEQKREWLPKLAAGAIGAFGLTEPDSGSDSAGLRTRAAKDGDHYVLNGTKRYITNGPIADMVLVMARTSAENLPKNAHVSAFLVPTDTPGLTRAKPDKKMGQVGALTGDIVLEDVRVPASALLGGEEGRGFKTAMMALDTGRFSVGSSAIGYSRRILESALRYATERKAFGETIANFQLIQAMLADSKVELYAAESMLADALRRAEDGLPFSTEASCVKLFATEACGRIADRAVQIYGGAGYMAEYEVERFYRDVRVYRIYEGTTQIQQLVIAKNMLREFAAQG